MITEHMIDEAKKELEASDYYIVAPAGENYEREFERMTWEQLVEKCVVWDSCCYCDNSDAYLIVHITENGPDQEMPDFDSIVYESNNQT